MSTTYTGILTKSGHQCSLCGVELQLFVPGDICDVVLLQVVTVFEEIGVVSYKVETDDENEYLYAPHMFCLVCWESLVEKLQEASESHEHHKTITVKNDVVRCDECNSGVLEGELFAIICSGGLHRSAQTPSGYPEVDFKETSVLDRARIMCIGCMKLIDANVKELWDADVSQGDECDEGTFSRCWRYARCNDCGVR